MTMGLIQRSALVAALLLSGAAFAQGVDATPPNANTMANPPSATDAPAPGVPIEGRAANEHPLNTPSDTSRGIRSNTRPGSPNEQGN
jgi:hypothetical protein